MTLKSFPRGGKKPVCKPNNGLLFVKKHLPGKQKKQRGKKSLESKEEENNFVADTAECLTYSTLGEGTVVLGRVHEITEYDMIVSLPGRLSGRIQATDLGQSYTALLRNIVNSEDGNVDEFKPLSELYHRGKYVVCSVKSVNPGEKWRVSLSLEPELINRNLDPGKLSKGSKIVGTVSSIEDHGYVIDTGIDNFRCFLARKDIDEGAQYYPGKQLFCAIKSVKRSENSTIAQLTSKSKHVGTAISNDSQSLDAQIPGTKFVLIVERVLKNGLQVSFNNGSVGYVNRMYLDAELDAYERGNNLHGVLMYVMPTLKFGYFTLLASDEGKERLSVGDIFDKARVAFIGPKGIVMNLKKGIRGWVPFRRTELAYEKISSKFAPETTHKCRVMSYDLTEQIYVCTMEKKLLEEQHFATSKLEPGERLRVEITKIQPETGYLMVTSGRTKGWVPPEHVNDPEISNGKFYKIGDTVEARVLGRDKKQKGVQFTLKKSLVESTLPILHDFNAAKVGAEYLGTIVQITSKGLLVCFYDHVKGFVPAHSLDKKFAAVRWNYTFGQVIKVRIVDVKRTNERMTLAVATDVEESSSEEADFEIGETVEGTVVEASVEGVHLRITKFLGDTPRIAFLPAGHLSPCEEVASYLAARYSIGQKLSALVFSTKPIFLLSRTFVPSENHRDFDNLKIDDCLPCSVHEINENGAKLVLPIKNFDSYGHVASNYAYRVHQILFARVATIDRKTRKINLVTSLRGILESDKCQRDDDLMASVDTLTLHFAKLTELSDYDYYKSKPISKMKIGARVSAVVDKVTDHGLVVKLENDVVGTVRKDHYARNFKPGDTVNGAIVWINYVHELVEVTLLPKFVHAISTKQEKLPAVSIETQLRADIVLVTSWFILVILKGAGKGLIAALPARRHLNDVTPDLSPYTVGKRLKCYVVLNRSETDLIPICLVKSVFEVKPEPEINHIDIPKLDLKRKAVEDEENETSKKKKKKTTTTVPEAGQPEVQSLKKKKTIKEETKEKPEVPSKPDVPSKKKKTKKEETKEEEKPEASSIRKKRTKKEETEEEEIPEVPSIKKKSKKSETKKEKKPKVPASPEVNNKEEKLSKKRKLKTKTTTKEIVDEKSSRKKLKLQTKEKREESPIEESPESVYSESDDEEDEKTGNAIGLPECGFYWDDKPDAHLLPEESSSEEEDNDPEVTKNQKKKKLSAAERREAERQKEREIRQREEALASNDAPNSVDQFDRLVLSSPDSSIVWVRYMAYHLQATEIEKARAVAKRALKTINFREENERLNVWQAWLNLESRFGSPDSLEEVFKDAVRTNDARAIYLHMLTVHADAGRQSDLEKIVTTILGKFKQFPDSWYECGAAFLKMGLKEKSRRIMQRALQSLPAQEHVNLMVKFAHLENKYGDKERAQTLFEQVLTSYPKRVDVWSSYVDALVKLENYDAARKVLEKAVVQTIPARKMKTLFKKFIDFEKKHGTPEGVSHVQELALKYIENECNKDT